MISTSKSGLQTYRPRRFGKKTTTQLVSHTTCRLGAVVLLDICRRGRSRSPSRITIPIPWSPVVGKPGPCLASTSKAERGHSQRVALVVSCLWRFAVSAVAGDLLDVGRRKKKNFRYLCIGHLARRQTACMAGKDKKNQHRNWEERRGNALSVSSEAIVQRSARGSRLVDSRGRISLPMKPSRPHRPGVLDLPGRL
ncbi:hypothetical protein VTK73DRAFT_322 [Phialemonium thermophilum]|uniref:Uncharacterized protein n=1 Tax=Phialemonium thermophilum TaxID=223376 RepID=A0ABR3VVN6_9PEZI